MSELQLESLTKGLRLTGMPKARQLRALLPAIENTLAAGYTHQQVHAKLTEEGVVVSFLYYQNLLHRLRSELLACASRSKTRGGAIIGAGVCHPAKPKASVSPTGESATISFTSPISEENRLEYSLNASLDEFF